VKWSVFKGHVNFLGYVIYLCHEFSEDYIVRETQRLPHEMFEYLHLLVTQTMKDHFSTSNEKVLSPMAWACLSF